MKTDRMCEDCAVVPVSGRRRRCESCRKAGRARAMRERRAAESGPDYSPESTELGRSMIDYTLPWAASKPPNHDAHRPPARNEPVTEVVDYTNGGHAAPGSHRLDYSRVPGEARRDFVKATQLARQLAADEDNELGSWDEVQASGQQLASTVDFSQPMTGGLRGDRRQYAITNPAAVGLLYGGSPDYGAAAAGNAVRTARPQQNQSGSRTPHIIN
jgi:hypothetical protein